MILRPTNLRRVELGASASAVLASAVLASAVLASGCAEPCPPTTPQPLADQAAAAAVSSDPMAPASTVPTTLPAGMVEVPAGAFLRGAPDDVGLRDEHPQRTIELDAFAIDRTEVSVADFARCVAAGACRAPACSEPGDEPESRDEFPVVCVPWQAAADFCKWAGKRLPTEAEWEKAARGPDGALWPWGDDEPTCERANYYDCGNERKPVDSLPNGASRYGALHMAGNVYEWVADWHHADYYALSPSKNPPGPWSGEKKIVRGGAFSYQRDELSSSGRTYDRPGKAYDQVGFRCAAGGAATSP